MASAMATPGMGGYNWALPLNLGSDEAVYVEDNTFTLANSCFLRHRRHVLWLPKWCSATTR